MTFAIALKICNGDVPEVVPFFEIICITLMSSNMEGLIHAREKKIFIN